MAVEEHRRDELYMALATTLSPEAAQTMFDLLPSQEDELATRGDVRRIDDHLTAIDHRFVQVDRRFEAIDQRFAQIDQRFEAIDQRFAQIDQRFEAIDQRFEVIDQRFAQIDQRFDDLERHLTERIDDRIDRLRYELLAAFRGELVSAVAGQTRAVIVATATATFGIGGLAVTLAQLL